MLRELHKKTAGETPAVKVMDGDCRGGAFRHRWAGSYSLQM